MVSPPSSPPPKPTCRFKIENGDFCKRIVAPGEGLCWQHAKSIRHKLKSLTRSQTVGLASTVILGLGLGVPSLYFSYVDWRDSHSRQTKSETQKSITIKSANDEEAARNRFRNAPDHLTLHDLFLLDSRAVQQSSRGSVFVDVSKTIPVEYSINTDLQSRSKFLNFYISQQEQTDEICAYFAGQFKFVLERAPQLLVEEKYPGDSGTVSTKEAVFSNRIYIYHETYLPPEKTVQLTAVLSNMMFWRSFEVRTTWRLSEWRRPCKS
jgi:hypothetical protein